MTTRAPPEAHCRAIETVPGMYRRVAISDPEGNRVAFGEVPVAGD